MECSKQEATENLFEVSKNSSIAMFYSLLYHAEHSEIGSFLLSLIPTQKI